MSYQTEPPVRLGTTQIVAASTTSAETTNAFGSGAHLVRIAATADCHVVFGSSPNTATTSDALIVSAMPEYFIVNPGWKAAVVVAASTGTVSITEVSR